MKKKKPPITSSRTRSDRSSNMGQGNKKNPVSTPKPRTSAVSSMTRQGPTAKGTRTMSNRAQSPRLPKLPKNPTTTQTVRAMGGNSSSPKINRLSAQARPSSGVKSAPQMRKEAAQKAATRAIMKAAGKRAGAAGAGATLFLQGRSGSALDKAVQKLPGIKANQKTDLGARASRAIMGMLKKKKKK